MSPGSGRPSNASPEEGSELNRAREIFLYHDGSRFYMSRNGVEEEYLGYHVPPEIEARWRDELTATKISELTEPGNWRSLNYLCHHNNTGFLHAVAGSEPLGELWQRISYLELAVEYIERCKGLYPRREIRSAREAVHSQVRAVDIDAAPASEREGRDEMLRGRLRKLDATTTLLLSRTRFIRRHMIRLRWALTRNKSQ